MSTCMIPGNRVPHAVRILCGFRISMLARTDNLDSVHVGNLQVVDDKVVDDADLVRTMVLPPRGYWQGARNVNVYLIFEPTGTLWEMVFQHGCGMRSDSPPQFQCMNNFKL